MGKRKSAKPKLPPRRQEKLATEFKCPFWNHDSSVQVPMDRKNHVDRGELSCRVCLVRFSCSIDSLNDPIDVYSEWIDECERVNGGAARPPQAQAPSLEDALNGIDSRFIKRRRTLE